MHPDHRIAIYGAGSIGCYVGGRLAATGSDVVFIGRERIGSELNQHGLTLTDYLGAELQVPAGKVRFASDVSAAADADLVLVTVKSAATEQAGRELASVIRPDTTVVSFQNGIGNADVLGQHLEGQPVITGMVQFNVIHRGNGAFHQGSEGTVEAEADPMLATYLDAFERAGLPLEVHEDMRSVQWAKLLLNLNNPVNALSGVPLKQELSQRDFRRVLAMAQQEGLDLLQRAGIRPAKLTPLPPHWIPKLLTVPNWMFRLLANRMLAIDPLARSSMWEDLERGRTTEIDWINGEIVKLAAEQGREAPVNAKLIELIRAAEQGGKRDWTGTKLLAETSKR